MHPKEANEDSTLEMTAFEINRPGFDCLVPAPINRDWMDATPERFAYRCLPLAIANQSGWTIRCPSSFSALWNGGPGVSDTTVVSDETPPDRHISSLFGGGTISFNISWLFRTPRGVNLWVKGPANTPKDGVSPLEGVVESDWISSTFTMNWKLTRADHLVRFERGEPICTIVPIPRGFLEQFAPVIRPIASDPHLHDAFLKWSQSRDEFIDKVAKRDPETIRRQWQKDYFLGRDPGTPEFDEHQTKLNVRPFVRREE